MPYNRRFKGTGRALSKRDLAIDLGPLLSLKGQHGTVVEAAKVVDAIFRSMVESLRAGKEIHIHGLGSFKVKEVSSGAVGLKKKTGYTLQPYKTVRFRPSSHITEAIKYDRQHSK